MRPGTGPGSSTGRRRATGRRRWRAPPRTSRERSFQRHEGPVVGEDLVEEAPPPFDPEPLVELVDDLADLTEGSSAADARSPMAQALGRTRLLTLTGPGSAGETRLACKICTQLAATTTPTGSMSPNWRHCRDRSSRTRWRRCWTCRFPARKPPRSRWPGNWRTAACCWSWTTANICWTRCTRLTAEVLRGCPGVIVFATSRKSRFASGGR